MADTALTPAETRVLIRDRHAGLLSAAEAANEARWRKISRIPKYRRDERHALIAESDAAYAADLAKVREWDPMCREFTALHPNYHGTGLLSD